MGTVPLTPPWVEVNDIDASVTPVVAKCNELFYRGEYWCVPETFSFPRETNRLNEWRIWLQGAVVVSCNVTYKVKPFHSLQG